METSEKNTESLETSTSKPKKPWVNMSKQRKRGPRRLTLHLSPEKNLMRLPICEQQLKRSLSLPDQIEDILLPVSILRFLKNAAGSLTS